MGKFVCPMKETFQVFIRPPLFADVPVGNGLGATVANVFVAGTSVVSSDRVTGSSPQRLADRLTNCLAEDVPERDVDG